mgnify:CR=1 FL=1
MAQRIIKLNENELKGLIKNVLFEMAGFNDDEENDELNSVLNKYSKQTALPTSNNAEATAAEDAAETDIAAEEGTEGQGEFYIITYSDDITNSTDTWIGDAEEKAECIGDEYQVQGPFPTKEDAEEEARKQGLDPKDLVDDEGQGMVMTNEPADNAENVAEPEGPITSLSTQDSLEPETHQEGDIIYYENTPIEYSNGKYHMTIEDGFDMGDAKCPKITVVGSNLDAVKQEYENLWDNYYYKEHGNYAKDMIERGFAEYDMSNLGGLNASEIDLSNVPVIVNLDK